MEQPTVLRTTKIGGGFVKEDVLQYLDELNSKIESMEKELEEAKGTNKPAVDQQEIAKYRTQIDNLQEKLNAANNGWRAARKENEELTKQLDQIKAGKGIPTGNANQAALDAAKKEVAALKAQLAQQKSAGAGQQQNNAALDAAKREIDRLKAQLAQKPGAAPAADNSAINAELTKVKQDLAKAIAEIKSKTEQLNAKTKESADKDSKIAKLTKDVSAVSGKDAEITKLKGEISKLNEKMSNPTALLNDLMSNILNNAQESADKSKKEAEEKAASTLKEAQEKAAKIIKEADDKAKKTVDDANATAKKTIGDANNAADKAVRDANVEAKKLNEMSSTVRTLLLNEIESVNSKFTSLTDAVNKLAAQTTEKLKETNNIISEAKKAVETGKDDNIKLAEVKKADFKPADAPKSAFQQTAPKTPVVSGMDDIVIKKPVEPAKPAVNTAPQKPATPPVRETPKPAPKKHVSNFGFDMAELLKAAEEEAAKNAD